MANIDTYLQQIMAAIYGEEVRGSIHDAIEAINDQVDAAEETMEQFVQGAMDTTLTSTAKPAQGKAVGDAIIDLKNVLEIWDGVNLLDRFTKQNLSNKGITWEWNNSSCTVTGTATATANNDIYFSASVMPTGFSTGETYHVYYKSTNVLLRIYAYISGGSLVELCSTKTNIDITIPDNAIGMIIRLNIASGMTVNETVTPIVSLGLTNDGILNFIKQNQGITLTNKGTVYGSITSADDVGANTIYFVSSYGGTPAFENVPYAPCWLITIGNGNSSNLETQITMPYYNDHAIQYRMKQNQTWTDWLTIYNKTLFNKGNIYGSITSADDVEANTIYFVSSSGGTPAFENVPYAPCWLITIGNGNSSNLETQIAMPYYSDQVIQYRTKQNQTWTDWRDPSGNRTIYVNGDTYTNTYNINTSPSITTDSNGWLQPIDTDSTQEANATDMTGPILSMLNSTGYCHLAPGLYYVSGNIDLPFGSTLEGCGHDTIIRLLSSQQSAYIVKATRNSTVKDIRFSGGSTAPDLSSPDIGGRHGVAFIDDSSTSGPLPYVRPCIITGCWFENFSGAGIYCNDSGGGTQQGIIVSDCYIEYCEVGIDIWYYSEYHKFTNIITFHCYYACINNGGNNVFIGCTFHGTVGFMIDNASDNLRNPGHGSAVGCTFNHIDNWNRPTTKGGGSAVTIKGNMIGFVFSGCQFWYGTIDISDSAGVLFSDSQFGGSNGTPAITVTGQYPTFFNSCIFHSAPALNVNNISKFTGCFRHDTGAVVD